MLKGLSTRDSAMSYGLISHFKPSLSFLFLIYRLGFCTSNPARGSDRFGCFQLMVRGMPCCLALKSFTSLHAKSDQSIQTAIPLSVSLSLLVITSPPPEVCAVPI